MTSLTMILSPDQDDWQSTTMNKKNESLSVTVVTPKPSSSSKIILPSTPPPVPSQYMNVIKEKKMNPCLFCHKKFTKPSALKAHLFSHTGEKPNSCPHAGCDRQFSLLSNLRRHIKTHSPEAMRKQQQQRNAQADASITKRKITRILPSPYTSTMKTLPGVPQIYSSVRFETPLTKKVAKNETFF